MRLSLELPDGRKTAVNLEGPIAPEDRLETMQQICALLHAWALETEKDEQEA